MKIAFLFLTVGNHHQGALWETFFGNIPGERFSIACHPKFADQVTQPFLKENIIPHRISTEHGDISLVRATMLLLNHAFRDPLNECFILLSDSCIPIYGFNQVHDALNRNEKSFISYQTCKTNEGMERWRCLKDQNFVEFERFAKQHQWMALRRDLAEFILRYDYTDVFEKVYAPDEHYFINLLIKLFAPLETRVINHLVTFVNWADFETDTVLKHRPEVGTYQFRRSRPKTYHRLTTIDVMAARKMGCLFFRKVSPACDCSPLMRLIRAMNSL